MEEELEKTNVGEKARMGPGCHVLDSPHLVFPTRRRPTAVKPIESDESGRRSRRSNERNATLNSENGSSGAEKAEEKRHWHGISALARNSLARIPVGLHIFRFPAIPDGLECHALLPAPRFSSSWAAHAEPVRVATTLLIFSPVDPAPLPFLHSASIRSLHDGGCPVAGRTTKQCCGTMGERRGSRLRRGHEPLGGPRKSG